MATEQNWYNDGHATRSFMAALFNADALDEENIPSFLTQPQRWDDEYEAWRDAGYPNDDTDDGWDDFVAALPEDES